MTISFLGSIKKHESAEDIEVIVVDNGSLQDCGFVFREIYPNLVYIRSKKNLGFAGGNNLGIQKARGEYLLFLNNDTEITANFVNVLIQELDKHPEIGLLSPLILYFDNKQIIQYAGYTAMNYLTGRNAGIASHEPDNGQFDHITKTVGFCHGAAMICRRADLEQVGYMEERYFLYYEELDWCEKFRCKGKEIGFTGKAKIYHKESISVGKESPLKTYFMTRNRWLFIRRNTGTFNTIVFSIYYIFCVYIKETVGMLLRGRLKLAKAASKAMVWNMTHSKNSTDLGYQIPNK